VKPIHVISKIFPAITLWLLLLGCSRDYARMKNSVRRVSSEYSLMQRTASRLIKQLPGGTQKGDSMLLSPIEHKKLFDRYSFLYSTLNPGNPEGPADRLQWDSASAAFFYSDSTRRRIRRGGEVYGWHPSWMGERWRGYPMQLITTISFFAYMVDPATGGYLNPEDMDMWRMSEMVDSAHARKTRVLLSVACSGREQTSLFLSREQSWSTLVDSVARLVQYKQADGVEINFQDLSPDDRLAFLQFVGQLNTRVRAVVTDRSSMITIVLPSEDPEGVFDLPELHRMADFLVVQGFEYDQEDEAMGAVAPMMTEQGDGPSLDRTLRSYTEAGLDPEQTVLALPLYGSQWRGTLDPGGFYNQQFDRKVTYEEVRKLYVATDTTYILTSNLDPWSMTNNYLLEFPDSTSIECWFDDDYTLSRKIDLALARKLKGVGFWALGYEQGQPEIWRMVRDKFASDTVQVRDPVTAVKGYPVRLADWMLRHRDLLLTAAVAFAITVVVAFFIAFSDWRVRASVFYNGFNYYLYILLSTVLLVPLLSWLGLFGPGGIRQLVAFLTGILVGYLIFRLTKAMQMRRP
jgi:spore germination protein YaaH